MKMENIKHEIMLTSWHKGNDGGRIDKNYKLIGFIAINGKSMNSCNYVTVIKLESE